MKEIIRNFLPPSSEYPVFKIYSTGISYCDGSYLIERKNSDIYNFEYIISGTGTVCVDGNEFYPQKGDIYFLHSGSDHRYFSDGKNPWVKIWFNISGSLVEGLINSYGLQNTNYVPDFDLEADFREFYSIANKTNYDIKTIFDKNAVNLHIIIQKIASKVRDGNSKTPKEVLKIKEYIDRNAGKDISLELLSKLFFRSPSHIIRLFKQYFGVTPYEYLLNQRVILAKMLMKNTNMLIKEVAENAGYKDEHYFSNHFKSKTGFSPSEYRKCLF